ncbi:MAG TPA: single-stranded-DNA-specific exonuclease RecJ, partial [Flavobacterium sp.]|nr:single-stranded-DNA-specific exonuclease RecJ [Flavobacterium sp.]
NFDIYNALEACAEYLEQFGGHMYAAGMTLKPENYQKFKLAFENEVQKTIHPDLLVPEISIDVEINFSQINPRLIRLLNQFEPFGPQNMTPVFITKNVKDTGHAKLMGKDEEHLRLFIKQNNSEGIPAIGFGLGSKIELTQKFNLVDVVYSIEENEWNGTVNLQLKLRDLRQSE